IRFHFRFNSLQDLYSANTQQVLDAAHSVSVRQISQLNQPRQRKLPGFFVKPIMERFYNTWRFRPNCCLETSAGSWQHRPAMRQIVFLLALLGAYVPLGHGAILVGANGSGVISFSSRPASTEWATKSISGSD